MTIRFINSHRQFKPGDLCDSYDEGVCRELIQRRIAEGVETKSIDAPARDKSFRSTKRKQHAAI